MQMLAKWSEEYQKPYDGELIQRIQIIITSSRSPGGGPCKGSPTQETAGGLPSEGKGAAQYTVLNLNWG